VNNKNRLSLKPSLKMNLLTITQEFLFLFSAASAGKIPNGWKLERKLKVFREFHLLQDFSFMLRQDSKKILKRKF